MPFPHGNIRGYTTSRSVSDIIKLQQVLIRKGAALLVAEYYTRKQASVRFALFFTFGVLGPCISGLLAYGIRNMNGIQGKEGWR